LSRRREDGILRPVRREPGGSAVPNGPAYLDLAARGVLGERVAEALGGLGDCTACPRNCHVDRLANERGVCRVGRRARVSSAFAHHGEEDVLRGTNGSGTIFFNGCNLKCVFCQNWEISQDGGGTEVDAVTLGGMMLALQDRGCHNINLVTPEHVVPQVLEAVEQAVAGGLNLPIVYNTSGYDSLESLRLLDGVVDIYMPDFKVWEPETAHRLLKARDYPQVARRAIAEMQRQVGPLQLDERGLAVRGLLVRHLVMPGLGEETRRILGWLAELHPDTYVNVMDQYRPAGLVARHPERYEDVARGLTASEWRDAWDAANASGLRLDRRST
jgi:putative pyruvate formate lyase activating enzyme